MVVYKNKRKKLYSISNNFRGGGDNLKIDLIDVDGHNFPNLPLMKISAFHKRYQPWRKENRYKPKYF